MNRPADAHPGALPGPGPAGAAPDPDLAAALASVPLESERDPIPGEAGADPAPPPPPPSLVLFQRHAPTVVKFAAAYADGWSWPQEVRDELAAGLAEGLADLFPNVAASDGGPWLRLGLAIAALAAANVDLETGRIRSLRKPARKPEDGDAAGGAG